MKKIILRSILICSIMITFAGCTRTNAKYYYESAVYEYEEKDYDTALNYIKSAIEKEPEKKEYYICSGMINLNLNNNDAALEDFNKSFSQGTEDIDKENNKSAYRGRGMLYLNMGKYTEALADFDNALKIECLKELDIDIKKFKIEALIKSEDFNKASLLCDEVISNEGEQSDILIQKGICETKLAKYDSAKQYFDKALDKKNNLAYYYLAIMYKEQGKLDESIKTIKEYMNKDSKADKVAVYCDISSSYIDAGEYNKAIETIKEAYKYANDSNKKYLMRNEIAAIEGTLDFAGALAKAQEYIKIYPDDEVIVREIEFLKTRVETSS